MLLIILVLLINAATAFILLPHVAPIWSWVLAFAVLVVGGCLFLERQVRSRIRVPTGWPRSVALLVAGTDFGVTAARMLVSPRLKNERSSAQRRLQGLAILSSLALPLTILCWAMALLATS